MSTKEVDKKKSLYWTILKKTSILFLILKKNDHSNILLDKNGLLDKLGASFKKVTKYQLKLKTKPWIIAIFINQRQLKIFF